MRSFHDRSGPLKLYDGKGLYRRGDEPIGVLDHPVGVDAHVVGHHVAGQANAALPGALPQIVHGRLAAEVAGDLVIEQRIGRGDRIGVAGKLLDALRGRGCAPTGRSATGR